MRSSLTPYLVVVTLAVGCAPSGPTEATNELLTVQATASGLVLTNRSPSDSVFARASYKYTGVQYWMDPILCAVPGLAPGEQRTIPYSQLVDHGKSTDRNLAVVQSARRAVATPTASDCVPGSRLTVRIP